MRESFIIIMPIHEQANQLYIDTHNESEAMERERGERDNLAEKMEQHIVHGSLG